MNIYIVTRENLLGGKAGASRVRCYAKAILNSGYSCRVLLIKQTIGNGVLQDGEFENISYTSMGKEITTKRTDITRYISYLRDDMSLLKYLKKNLNSGDVVFEYGATIFHTFLLINLAHKKGAKFVRDLCEYPFGTQKESIQAKFQRWVLLNFQFKKYDGVISISDALCKLAEKYCKRTCKIIKVPILVEYNKYALKDMRNEANVPYIFHSGTLYEQKDGFVSIIDAFGRACKRKEFKMNFISTGSLANSPHASTISELIHKYHIEDRVTFTGYLTSQNLCDYLQKASVVIINKYQNQQNTYCFSTKLAEYLAAGKTVIITRVGEAMNWLTDGKDSYIIEPQNQDILVNAILTVCNDINLQRLLGENARQTCRDFFDYRMWSRRLSEFLQDLYK